jgi:hypothetical protein
MGMDRQFERATRLVVLSLRGVDHGQVVVRLRQLGVVFGQIGEYLNRLGLMVELGEDDPFHEPPLGVLRAAGKIGVHPFQGGVQLPLIHELGDLLQFICPSARRARCQQEQRACQQPKDKFHHCVILYP